jgi:hypothetical protein
MRRLWILLWLAALVAGRGAELSLDFADDKAGGLPAGFRSALAGGGKPGDWQVLMDEAPPALPALSTNNPALSKQRVVAQLSRDPTDERYPLLVYEPVVFGDFTLTARLKTVAGAMEQMAGIAFRLQDERNFYVARFSSLGNNFRFYRVFKGQRDNPIGPAVTVPKGEWQEVTVRCKGNRIQLLLNGKEVMPELTDNTFATGKIGFWTKSDAVSYFAGLRVDYTPKQTLAQTLVRETVARHKNVHAIRISARSGTNETGGLVVIASSKADEVGQEAGKIEKEAFANDTPYFGKVGKEAMVTMLLRDRNGEPAAVVRMAMKSFPGQNDKHALARATPIIQELQARVRNRQDLTE